MGKVKTVYWIRHAHAIHNERQEHAERQLLESFPGSSAATASKEYRQARKAALKIALNGIDVFDSPLSSKGCEQADALRVEASKLVADAGVEVVLTSSLRRTVATAWTAFGKLVPVIAHDELREIAGAFDCEKRVRLSVTTAMFPHVDFSACSEEDTLWVQQYREATAQAVNRGVRALELVMAREEKTLAVVSHGAFSSGAVFGSPHSRIKSSCDPPRLNCEVRAVQIVENADGTFILTPVHKSKL
eukprot:TRINITY_DN87588_c0_g1_i1.p1 TRINITY_DN87588_c0_g1~~TRINITY_DN87588_c0_g1_i1.p1  ORF type:complete len:246 (+),score=32.37 TRINITY_DN87588_c0_g1_i1:82-819(+)